ncbi:dna-directed rna polymerase iii 130 kda polypeptide, partial [Vairimorpha apis BRL 01]
MLSRVKANTFNNVGSGEIQQIIERKSRAYGDILELTTLSAVPTLITLIISFYSIYINLGSHALFVMIITGTIYVILTFIFSVWRTKVRRAYNKSQDISSNKLQDFLANHVTIKSYNTEENTIQYYDETQKSVEYYGIKSHRILYGMFYLQKLIFSFQAIIIIALGCYGFFPIKLNPQQLVFYISISKTLTSSLNEMGMLYNRYVQGFLNAKSGYFEFKEPDQSGLLRVAKFEKQIEFKNITFSYNNNNILKNTSFLINKNEKVAIIGKNGTGKSTIIKILMKFYNYDGQILLDNNDIQIIADRVYRSIIAYATQNTFLFNNTVSYNIKYGNKQISNEKILEYSKKMGIFEHIQELDNKFDTYVGERGRLLPGGERQKIMLMRSLLKTSQILLMDEPTSALDRSSESEIIEFILNEEKGLARQHIESFNYFIDYDIPNIIKVNDIVDSDIDHSFYLKYIDVRVGMPSIEENMIKSILYPMECRLRDLTYASNLYVDIEYVRNKQIIKKKNVFMGRIPIMLKSNKCFLGQKKDEIKISSRTKDDDMFTTQECPYDIGGYFIVRGVEKVILIQEQLSKNRIIVENGPKGFYSSVTSSTHENKSKTSVTYKNDCYYIKNSVFTDEVPVIAVIKACNLISDREIVECIGTEFSDNITLSFEEISKNKIFSTKQALLYLSNFMKIKPDANKCDEVRNALVEKILPNVNYENVDLRNKGIMICLMIRRLILTQNKILDEEDKDFIGNKRFELAGQLLSILFEDSFKKFNWELKRSIDKILTKRSRAQEFDALTFFNLQTNIITT